MVGRNPGRVTTQGERLAHLFGREGFPVTSVSKLPNRYARLADIVWTLWRQRRVVDIQVLQVFGGPSFVVEDIASSIARAAGQRIVMILRGGNMPAFINRYPAWFHRVLDRADALIVPSEYLARVMRRYNYACSVIPNIIEIDAYPYRRRSHLQPRLFWMRAFRREAYNPAMAVRVLARLRKVKPDATLLMGGQYGPAMQEVQELANRLGVSAAVRFPGFLDMPAKLREANSADIFVHTNYIDNMPVSVVEAFALGLPVVATHVGGIGDLVSHEYNGLLVPADADAAMVDAILRLLGDSELGRRLADNGRRLAEICDWQYVRPQLEAVFESALRQKGANIKGGRN